MPCASMKSESATASSRSSEPWLMKTWPAVAVIQLPPLARTRTLPQPPRFGNAAVAAAPLAHQLHRHRRRFAAADAERRDTLPPAVRLERAEQGGKDARAAGA